MKKIFYFISIMVLSSSFYACERCAKCTHAILNDSEICRENFDSEQDYQDAISAVEVIGYNCQQ